MTPKRKRPRTERREKERELRKEIRARSDLADRLEGGSPEKPIRVASASQVEVHAAGMTCPICGEVGVRVDNHEARMIGSKRLRVVGTTCRSCNIRRSYYFELIEPVLN